MHRPITKNFLVFSLNLPINNILYPVEMGYEFAECFLIDNATHTCVKLIILPISVDSNILAPSQDSFCSLTIGNQTLPKG